MNETLERQVIAALKARGLTLAAAESCTGGLTAKRLTDVPGASAVFLGGERKSERLIIRMPSSL